MDPVTAPPRIPDSINEDLALDNTLRHQREVVSFKEAYKKTELLDLYRIMSTSREVDRLESEMVKAGEAFFHVSGAGHEGSAVLNRFLLPNDWLHLHYRDKALMLGRGVSPEMFFHSLLCNAESHSAGRQMSAHMSAPHLRILSTVGPVGNNALQAVGVASVIKNNSDHSIVVCSMGDGTTQQGEVFEAFAEASRSELPVLFWIEDNEYSISTTTKFKTFYSLRPDLKHPDEFFGIPIHRLEGRDVLRCHAEVDEIVLGIRSTGRPAIVISQVARLASHTNADDERIYRSREEIERTHEASDPIRSLAAYLSDLGMGQELDRIDAQVEDQVRSAAQAARRILKPNPTLESKKLIESSTETIEYRGNNAIPRMTMLEAIRAVLRVRMESDLRITLYGEDIEDPKGDVFGLTKGISTAFPDRVKNSPLSESTIIGVSIGRALAGERPVAFIQFADFLPLAFNQIISELGSMHWRTDGGWQCPVIVMVACGGYRPGLGPFHAQTLESVMAHVPGVDVVMPSNAADAAGLLNAAFQSGRPTIFFYPKSCLNDPDRATSADVGAQLVPLGKARYVTRGDDLTIVTWGSTLPICERVVANLEDVGLSVDLMDLRSISPWDEKAVCGSARRTGKLIVVHEDNRTCGFGGEVISTVAETVRSRVECRRVVRPDTFVPCNYSNQLEVLPSFRRIITAAAEILDLDISWDEIVKGSKDEFLVKATGSSPADQSVTIISWEVRPGDQIRCGGKIAEVESDKAVSEFASPVSGSVEEILVAEGISIRIGTPILRIRKDYTTEILHDENLEEISPPKLSRKPTSLATAPPLPNENGDTPQITHRSIPMVQSHTQKLVVNSRGLIYTSRPACVLGSLVVSSESLAANISGWTFEEVVKRTGVASRYWASETENVVSLAIQASLKLLSSSNFDYPPITAVICSTTTPRESSPAIACQIATSLRDHKQLSANHFAFDFNAACSGFLYGLRLASDLLRGNDNGTVLLVTAEVPSPMLDRSDASTVFLFGDAATATLISARSFNQCLEVEAPICLTLADPEVAIHLPSLGTSRYLKMNGIIVARTAYKAMANVVHSAIKQAGISLEEVAALIPHPGSKRILQNVAENLEIDLSRVLTTLPDTGNTSSSSIPLALDRYWDQLPYDGHLAFTAFGAGFTTAATTAKRIKGIE